MTDDKVMLVVSITSGRSFPPLKDKQLIIEGRFNDEKLYSDPVLHTSAPQVNTELAWELDRKAVHHHKIQRTPIKLNVFASSAAGPNEQIGYIVIDLRSASTTHQSSKWMPLLNSKYNKFKPELSVQLGLEEESGGVSNNVATVENKSGKLTVETKEDNGRPFLQIGKGGAMHIFSLSLISGEKLVNLLPAKKSVVDGFYWFYQLRGNDVVHEPFHELTSPFPIERASLSIQGGKADLSRFLAAEVCPIEIHLCSGDFSLGHAMVQFSKQLVDNMKQVDLGKSAAIITQTVPIKANPSMGGAKGASIKIELSIRTEAVPQTPLTSELFEHEQNPLPRGLPKPTPNDNFDTDHDIEDLDQGDPTTTSSHLIVPQVPSHYSFSMELKSLRLNQHHQISVYVKYTYPFFGSSKPIFSGAPVPLHMKNQQVKLSEPFCQFDFACEPKSLVNQFQRQPIVLEIWARSQNTADQIIGTALVPIEKLLPANTKPKILTEVLAIAFDNRRVGDIDIKFWLENKGPVKQQIIIQPSNEQINPQQPQYQQNHDKSMERQEEKQKLQFKAALELQLWKDEQEQEFMSELKQKEENMIQRVANEFARRESERDQIMNRKVTEYEKMEKQLRKALAEAKKSETRVSEQERELGRIRDELQNEKDRIRQDAKTAFEQQKRELTGLLKVERAKTAAAEERASKYRDELDETDHKYKSLLNELEVSKRQAPDPHLHAEVKSLLVEKNEMDKRVETLLKAKQHYKLQWSRAIKEVASMKEREIEGAEAKLRRKQEEMEHMRTKYLQAQEHHDMIAERDTIRGMKNEFKTTQKSFTQMQSSQVESEGTIYINRLMEEKDQLLKSGAYSEQDQVIQEINRKLREISCTG